MGKKKVNQFENESEIEFICYYTLRILEWSSDCIGHCGFEDRKYILNFVKFACKLFPTNGYFMSCIRKYNRNGFGIRSVYQSLMQNDDGREQNHIIVWIHWMQFEIEENA